jgi:hypothetical protein
MNGISSINNILPACVGYGSNYSFDDAHPTHESADLDILDFVATDEQTIIKVHLENLWKQNMAWKLHYYNSPTWAFLR